MNKRGIVLAALSGLLLATAYRQADWFALTWIAFVPLLMALDTVQRVRTAYLFGLVMGIVFYTTAAYWFVNFAQLLKGYPLPQATALSFLFWLYCAQLPALLSAVYIWVRKHSGLNEILVFPVFAVVAYALFPMLFPVQLGESQSRFLLATQATDITGVHGLDFILVLFNTIIFLIVKNSRDALQSRLVFVGLAIIAGWFSYGAVSLSNWNNKIVNWPTHTIGIVQPNQAPDRHIPPPEPGYTRTYPFEMAITEKLADAGAELVIWPETRFKGYYKETTVNEAYRQQAKNLATPFIFHDLETQGSGKDLKSYHTLVGLDEKGTSVINYRKTKLIAYAESIPFLKNSSTLKKLMGAYGEGFFKEVTPGEGPTIVNIGGVWLAPVICYEVMFSDYSAQAVAAHPKGAVLAAVSNNSWFGNSIQPLQHLNSSILRAVENRVPLIHVMNNGPSGLVMPNGELIVQTEFYEQAGYKILMPYEESSGGSFYTKNPYLFLYFMYILLLLLVAMSFKRALQYK